MTPQQKANLFASGIVLLFLALALITMGFGYKWGTTGALIAAGVVCGRYGFYALSKL